MKEKIIKAIEDVMNIPFEDWKTSRKRDKVMCRQLYCYFVKDSEKMTFAQLSRLISRKAPTTSKRVLKSFKNDYETDSNFRRIADEVAERIK